MSGAAAVGIVFLIAIVTILGDYFLKLASQQDQVIQNRWFVLGITVYALCAFGWVYVMRHLKLATIGALYATSTILLLTALGVIVFSEKLDRQEVLGIGLAVLSIALLVRFSE